MKNNKVLVGTRGSKLAMHQCERAVSLLKKAAPGQEFEIKKIRTLGDKDQDLALNNTGGVGIFVKELEKALLAGEIDLAVHSLKDLPTDLPQGLKLGAVTEREDPRDALITNGDQKLDQLSSGALLGTGSLRRSVQLRHFRSDLNFVPVRGNLDTRLRKLREGQFDALVLALAGIKRLGRQDEVTQSLPLDICLPAAGQGAVGIEIRSGDEEMESLSIKVDNYLLRCSILAERMFLNRLGGGCHVPIGALANAQGKELVLKGSVVSLDGREMLKEEKSGDVSSAEEVGISLAEELLAIGAGELLQ